MIWLGIVSAYIAFGVLFAVTIERRTKSIIAKEGGPTMVGLVVAAWPVAMVVAILALIGFAVGRLSRIGR